MSNKTDAATLRREFYQMPDEAMLDRETVGAAFYLAKQTLEALAIKGGGPPYTRIGRRALYRKADVLAWAEKAGRRVENTAQLAGVAA